MNIDCSIIISSCDAFEDAWGPFFVLWSKYWPDCPYPTYLISNYKRLEGNPKIHSLSLGQDRKWSSNLKEALQSVTAPYVIYLQEDYFLNSKVDTAKIESLVAHVKKHQIACLRLFPSPGPNQPYLEFTGLGQISSNAPYRISTQAALWDKKILDSLLVDGETGWDFELKKNQPSQSDRLFLSVKKPVISYVKSTGIKKGRWTYDALQLFKQEGINVGASQRLAETKQEYIKRKVYTIPVLGRFVKYLWR